MHGEWRILDRAAQCLEMAVVPCGEVRIVPSCAGILHGTRAAKASMLDAWSMLRISYEASEVCHAGVRSTSVHYRLSPQCLSHTLFPKDGRGWKRGVTVRGGTRRRRTGCVGLAGFVRRHRRHLLAR